MNPPANHRRVLVIDDHRAIHKDLRKTLAPPGEDTEFTTAEEVMFGGVTRRVERVRFTIDSAFQGQEGLARVHEAVRAGQPYALAFVDVRMPPGWDGVETIGHLWRADPDLQIILCTAYSDCTWEELAVRLDLSDRLVILKKPFDPVEAMQLAHALSEKWRLRWQSRVELHGLERRVAEHTHELRMANEKLQAEMAERTRTEQALRQAHKMEVIGQFAGGIAHDFNNLLAVIRGYSSGLLADMELRPQTREWIRRMDEAAQQAANLTSQLLSFSRKQVVQPQVLDLCEIVGKQARILERLLGADIALEVRSADGPVTLRADRSMLDQVVLNLTVNARDAMPKGGQLTLHAATVELDANAAQRNPQARPGAFACLRVSDTGCGIAPEVMARLFEPFFTTKEIGKGTGLGLATVHGIVQQHQGWIEVDSILGRGTTFSVFLPLAVVPAAATTAATTFESFNGKETILLVDDEPMLCDVAGAFLKRYGYRVYTARSGADALEVWGRHRSEIDLLLTDVVMPDGLSGRELARQLLNDRADLKVTFTSGYDAEFLDRNEPLPNNLNFLPKPFTPQKLARIVRGCLDGVPVLDPGSN
jgi:two-component system, NtrC family, sensor kinase